jgi:hypothetical protein
MCPTTQNGGSDTQPSGGCAALPVAVAMAGPFAGGCSAWAARRRAGALAARLGVRGGSCAPAGSAEIHFPAQKTESQVSDFRLLLYPAKAQDQAKDALEARTSPADHDRKAPESGSEIETWSDGPGAMVVN